MKKKLKKAAAMGLLTIVFGATLVGCDKKVECSMCGETKKCSTQTNIMGEQVNICDDCKKELQDMFK